MVDSGYWSPQRDRCSNHRSGQRVPCTQACRPAELLQPYRCREDNTGFYDQTKRFPNFLCEADGASVNLCDAVILALANGCPGLTNINVSSCGVLTDAAIIALANGCPGLTNVNLTSCKNVTDATIIALVNGCPGLSDLDLTSCINVTDAAIVALANRCPRVHCTQWDKNPNAIKEHF